MAANAIDNGGRITPGDDGVYQLITAAIDEVLVSEAETAQVIHVIWQFEIRGCMRPRDRSCFGRIGIKYDGLLDGQELIAAQNLPRTRRVLRRHEICMRAVRSLCGDLAHFRSKCSQNSDGCNGRKDLTVRIPIHAIQVLPHRTHGFPLAMTSYLFYEGNVADTE